MMTTTSDDWRHRRAAMAEFWADMAANTFEPGSVEAEGFTALVERVLLIQTETEYRQFMDFSLNEQRELLLRLSRWGMN